MGYKKRLVVIDKPFKYKFYTQVLDYAFELKRIHHQFVFFVVIIIGYKFMRKKMRIPKAF